jgi:membrane fusion protein, multidrug efflux system
LLAHVRKHPLRTAAIVVLVIAAVLTLWIWWLNARQFESTDDAFIDARTLDISSQVPGAIVDVPVTDNQLVNGGAVLARIDSRDYRAQLDQAKAQVEQAQANIANLDAQIAAQKVASPDPFKAALRRWRRAAFRRRTITVWRPVIGRWPRLSSSWLQHMDR